jgi:hypothetical protein
MAYQTVSLDDFQNQGARGVDGNFNALIAALPPLTTRGPWLAGGSVRKYMNGMENRADYDIFFKNQEQCDTYCEALLNEGAEELGKNIFNRSFKLHGTWLIQCIHHEFRNTLIQTMNRFDITICQFGYDGTSLVWSDEASEDVKNMEFHFLGTSDPVYNLNRAFKYAREGFKPADGEVKKILSRVADGKVSVKGGRKISGPAGTSTVVDIPADFAPDGGGIYIAPAPAPAPHPSPYPIFHNDVFQVSYV